MIAAMSEFAPLRPHPRFQALLRRMNLPAEPASAQEPYASDLVRTEDRPARRLRRLGQSVLDL
jgi:hypothetical protein